MITEYGFTFKTDDGKIVSYIGGTHFRITTTNSVSYTALLKEKQAKELIDEIRSLSAKIALLIQEKQEL